MRVSIMPKRSFQPIAVRATDAAAMLGVSQGTLRSWIAEGRIRPPYSLGPRLQLFDVEQLAEDWEKLKSEIPAEASPNPWDEVVE